MLWIVAPLAVSIILMQLYFGRNPTEKLGWNTAFGNSIAIIFVSVNLLQYMYRTFGPAVFTVEFASNNIKVLIAFILLGIGFLGMFLDFFHWLPEKLAFFIMSAIPVNLTAYMAIVLVYSDNVPIDRVTFVTAIVFFFALIAAFGLVRWVMPMSRQSKQEIRQKRAERKAARAEKKRLKESKKSKN
ncbi:hypothetical protein KY316_03975 [Candidatus Woesearchaeota archaeon]|nr:hypothetical protein [Candidatus Woesearchaeota archaeon]